MARLHAAKLLECKPGQIKGVCLLGSKKTVLTPDPSVIAGGIGPSPLYSKKEVQGLTSNVQGPFDYEDFGQWP